MNRISWVLLLVFCLEIAASVVWYRGHLAALKNDIPRPDLSMLDSSSVQEVISTQQKVLRDRKAESWTALAMNYQIYGFFLEADDCYRRAAELNPKSDFNNFWWGAVLYRLGRLDESSEKFRAAIPARNPSQGGICWYCIGMNFLREEQLDKAEEAFRRGTGAPAAEFELARLLVRTGRPTEATPLLERLTQIDPQSPWIWLLRGNAAEALGDSAHAQEYREHADRVTEVLHASEELTLLLEKRIAKQGLDAEIEKGRRLLSSGSKAEAVKVLREVLSKEWRPQAADMLAKAELVNARPDEAIRVLNEAIDRFGSTPERLTDFGDAWKSKGNADKASQAWEHATRLGIAGAAHARLAEHFSKTGNETKSKHHRALAVFSEGLSAFHNDRLPQAEKSFAAAVKLAPEHAQSWFYLGECHRFLNQPAKAAEDYEKCLTINKYHGRAKRSMTRLEKTRD